MKSKYIAFYIIYIILPNLCFAGGMKEEGVSLLTTIRSTILAIVGVGCGILLIFEGMQGYSGKKTWGEVGMSCLWVLFIGGAVAIATWIFTKGQAIKM